MKKTIRLATNWYPTKENPFMGLFLKEQAFAVSEYFNIVVIHINERCIKKPFTKSKFVSSNKEKNTVEYTCDIAVPPSIYCS